MEMHKVILAFALGMLVAGQFAAGTMVLDEHQGPPILHGARLTAHGLGQSTLPVHGT